MINDIELCQHLNLLRTQGSFVYHEDIQQDRMTCQHPNIIPKASGVYWVHGATVVRSGLEIDSVFQVDTDSGGTLLTIFWWINETWYKHDDEGAVSALGLSKEEIFPFDWRFTVPLEEDIFHPTKTN